MGQNRDRAAAVAAADQVVIRIEPITCAQCEAQCWTVEGEATGYLGREGWLTSLVYVEHATLSASLAIATRALGAIGAVVREREERQWMLEHQPRLW